MRTSACLEAGGVAAPRPDRDTLQDACAELEIERSHRPLPRRAPRRARLHAPSERSSVATLADGGGAATRTIRARFPGARVSARAISLQIMFLRLRQVGGGTFHLLRVELQHTPRQAGPDTRPVRPHGRPRGAPLHAGLRRRPRAGAPPWPSPVGCRTPSAKRVTTSSSCAASQRGRESSFGGCSWLAPAAVAIAVVAGAERIRARRAAHVAPASLPSRPSMPYPIGARAGPLDSAEDPLASGSPGSAPNLLMSRRSSSPECSTRGGELVLPNRADPPSSCSSRTGEELFRPPTDERKRSATRGLASGRAARTRRSAGRSPPILAVARMAARPVLGTRRGWRPSSSFCTPWGALPLRRAFVGSPLRDPSPPRSRPSPRAFNPDWRAGIWMPSLLDATPVRPGGGRGQARAGSPAPLSRANARNRLHRRRPRRAGRRRRGRIRWRRRARPRPRTGPLPRAGRSLSGSGPAPRSSSPSLPSRRMRSDSARTRQLRRARSDLVRTRSVCPRLLALPEA